MYFILMIIIIINMDFRESTANGLKGPPGISNRRQRKGIGAP